MQVFLYNVFLLLYSSSIRLAALFNEKAKQWLIGRRDIFQVIKSSLAHNEKRLWIHCSSLGEFEQGRPLIEAIKTQYPHYRMVLTFFSPSGFRARKNYEHADYVFYLPMDSRKNAKRFIRLIKPAVAIFVKYEFWYHYLHTLKRKNVPTFLVSAPFRKSQVFFKWYGGLFRKMLGCFQYLFVQDKASKELLGSIGFHENVIVSGDTRYDRVAEIAQTALVFPLVEKWKGNAKLVIAGSTWNEDEKILKESISLLPAGWKMIIAPHEIDKARIKQVQEHFPGSVLYSQLAEGESAEQKVLVIDNIGMLSGLFRYGEIAYIGGGFKGGGIHNTLEPAIFGLPVIFGPVYKKFVEAVRLVNHGFAFPVRNDKECKAVLQKLMSDQNALKIKQEALKLFIERQTGATEKVMKVFAVSLNRPL